MLWCTSIFDLVFVVSLTKFGESTIDINPRQLQMVADSLTTDECRRLSESLHVADYQLDHTPTGVDEPLGVSCIRLLQHWDQHEGKDETFVPLATRLSQLGRADVANKLSKSVFDESVMQLREALHLPMITDDTTDVDVSFKPIGFELKSKMSEMDYASPQVSAKLIFALICSCILVIIISISGILILKRYPILYGRMKEYSSCKC